MENTQTAKNELLAEIECLQAPYLAELRNFVRYLRFRQSGDMMSSDDRHISEPEHDPILRGIGLCEAESFSDGIDDTLYGET